MRILFLNSISGFFGGVEQYMVLTSRGLSERGHHCFCASTRKSGRNQEMFDAAFEGVFDLGALSLQDVVREANPDVVFVHKFLEINEVFNASGKAPVVRMFHDHDVYCPRKHKYYAFTRRICTSKAGALCWADLAFLERTAKGIGFSSIGKKLKELKDNRLVNTSIVGSSYMKQQLVVNGFPESSVHVVHPCCMPAQKDLADLPKDPSILFVGQLIRGKGADVLLKAHAKLVSKTGTPIPLTLVGDGNDMEYLKHLASQLKTQDILHFAGWVDNQDLISYYDNAAVIAVPSRWPEPFGMVGVEAMLRARPVVASRAGGILEWLEEGVTGLAVTPGDADDLADKLEFLLEHPKVCKTYGTAGYSRAVDMFSYNTFIEHIESLLKGALA